MIQETQNTLPQEKIEAFYHDNFVETQVKDFVKFFGPSTSEAIKKVTDIGGGYGYFARALQQRFNYEVRVLDTDIHSIDECRQVGVDAIHGDALNSEVMGDEKIVCFNLILHHLVGTTEIETYKLQARALSVWHSKAPTIFVNEYIYELYGIDGLSGWLIFKITSNTFLSTVGNLIARIFPSLKANTFGVGVRFRSHAEWEKMFRSLGFEVVDTLKGEQEGVSLPRRMLLIKNCRRDSVLLRPNIK